MSKSNLCNNDLSKFKTLVYLGTASFALWAILIIVALVFLCYKIVVTCSTTEFKLVKLHRPGAPFKHGHSKKLEKEEHTYMKLQPSVPKVEEPVNHITILRN